MALNKDRRTGLYPCGGVLLGVPATLLPVGFYTHISRQGRDLHVIEAHDLAPMRLIHSPYAMALPQLYTDQPEAVKLVPCDF